MWLLFLCLSGKTEPDTGNQVNAKTGFGKERKSRKENRIEVRYVKELLNVSSNPHVRDEQTTSRIMLDVLIALIPASIFGIYNLESGHWL